MFKKVFLALSLFLFAACSISNRHDGVQNRWRKVPTRAFKNKASTEKDVLQLLGPPSRVVALKDRTVFYYLLEHDYRVGLNLVLYIQTDTKVRYDRAVFFFDKNGVLENHSFSRERIVEDDEEEESES